MYFQQSGFSVRFEWGLKGVEVLAPVSEAIIIVDVLSFSTAVSIATDQGAIVYPYRYKDVSAIDYAEKHSAILAQIKRNKELPSLSPQSLLQLKEDDRIVLPSPNGSTLAIATDDTPTLIGCLRNAEVTANKAKQFGNIISIIAAGEQWTDGSLRPSIEDLIGAGAIISHLEGEKSPEALIAQAAFLASRDSLCETLLNSISGKELVERGFERDVALAAELNVSQFIPLLTKDGYVSAKEPITT